MVEDCSLVFKMGTFLLSIVLTSSPLGSKPISSLCTTPRVSLLYLTEPPLILRRLPFIVGGPLKVLRQVAEILYTLTVRIPHPPEFILVQVRRPSESAVHVIEGIDRDLES